MTQTLKNHIVFWIVLLSSFSVIPFFQEGNSASLLELILQNTKRLPAMLITAYTFNEWLLPQWYKMKKYISFTLLAITLFYICAVLDRVINVYVYEPLFREPPFEQESLKQIISDVPFLVSAYVPPLAIATFAMTFEKVVRDKQQVENQNTALQRDKNLAELNALKSQLHPHFLFNTLNNLYALTVQKSDKAPETVEKLSHMLDYMLYQCDDKLVPLDKEVSLLENYISLERLRYGNEIKITFVKASSEKIEIAPLLLLSIVENAFKHGASESLEAPEVHIDLREEARQLYFTVRNTKNNIQQKDETGYSKGVGLSNLKQQLELIYLDFDYKIIDDNGWYTVALRINTSQVYD